MAIKRRSNVTAKFAKMRGLQVDEKRTFTRIGELIDAVINNRAPGNPGSKENRIITRTDPSLPPPRSISVQNGVRSAKLTWPAVNSSYLQFYEVRLTEAANGDQTTGIAYSNSFTVKDKEGEFRADIRSVGRDGTASLFTSITFTIMPNVLIYRGSKNLYDEVGSLIQVPLYSPKGYNIYFWGATVVDSFSDTPEFNYEPIYSLSVFNEFYMGGDFYSPSTFYLFPAFIESITTPPEEVTFTNLSVAAGGGSTNRPGGSPVRTGDFQTTMAVPFSPYKIPDLIADRVNIYWMVENHRDDLVDLALNAWVCTAGIAEVQTPGPVINCMTSNPPIDTGSGPRITSDPFTELVDFNNVGERTTFSVWVKFTGLEKDGVGVKINQGLSIDWKNPVVPI